ncbi:hypothetical protein [Streptomyces sp. NPDC127033]|uniref:vWA domain-containing protein n=1 Tax=Streptomyces sp. NPDC127033 TaxID=3347110 RepID=UPI00364FAF55
MTPIGHSLRSAAADLGDHGPRRIILVGDGEDTCAPPEPCDVAQELAATGIDLVIDAIGFRVDDAARAQLQCIARVTHGSYSDAADAGSLTRGLDASARSALTPYALSGRPVTGGVTCASAPVLAPGQFRDRMAYGEERWYRATVRPGQALRFSGSVIPRDDWEAPTSVRADIHLPGRAALWGTETSVEDRWAQVLSAGVESPRLRWDETQPGAETAQACAKLTNKVKTSTPSDVEVAVDLAGQAVSPDGTPDTSTNTSSATDAQPAAPAGSTGLSPVRPASSNVTSAGSLAALAAAAAIGLMMPLAARAALRRRKERS